MIVGFRFPLSNFGAECVQVSPLTWGEVAQCREWENLTLSRFAQDKCSPPPPHTHNFIVRQKHQVKDQTIQGESNKTKLKRGGKKRRYKTKLGDLNIFREAYTKSPGRKTLLNTFLDFSVADI